MPSRSRSRSPSPARRSRTRRRSPSADDSPPSRSRSRRSRSLSASRDRKKSRRDDKDRDKNLDQDRDRRRLNRHRDERSSSSKLAHRFRFLLPTDALIPLLTTQERTITTSAQLVHLAFYESTTFAGPLAELVGTPKAVQRGLVRIREYVEDLEGKYGDVAKWTSYSDEFLEAMDVGLDEWSVERDSGQAAERREKEHEQSRKRDENRQTRPYASPPPPRDSFRSPPTGPRHAPRSTLQLPPGFTKGPPTFSLPIPRCAVFPLLTNNADALKSIMRETGTKCFVDGNNHGFQIWADTPAKTDHTLRLLDAFVGRFLASWKRDERGARWDLDEERSRHGQSGNSDRYANGNRQFALPGPNGLHHSPPPNGRRSPSRRRSRSRSRSPVQRDSRHGARSPVGSKRDRPSSRDRSPAAPTRDRQRSLSPAAAAPKRDRSFSPPPAPARRASPPRNSAPRASRWAPAMPVPSADAPFSHPALTAFITFYRVSSAADQVRVRKALSATLGWPADSAEDDSHESVGMDLEGTDGERSPNDKHKVGAGNSQVVAPGAVKVKAFASSEGGMRGWDN